MRYAPAKVRDELRKYLVAAASRTAGRLIREEEAAGLP